MDRLKPKKPPAPEPTERLILEVPLTGNLDVVFRMFVGELNGIGAGLQAIALALSTPQVNSAEVQKKIDQYSERIAGQKEDLQEAINRQKGQ